MTKSENIGYFICQVILFLFANYGDVVSWMGAGISGSELISLSNAFNADFSLNLLLLYAVVYIPLGGILCGFFTKKLPRFKHAEMFILEFAFMCFFMISMDSDVSSAYGCYLYLLTAAAGWLITTGNLDTLTEGRFSSLLN